jgi:hypothetical protein
VTFVHVPTGAFRGVPAQVVVPNRYGALVGQLPVVNVLHGVQPHVPMLVCEDVMSVVTEKLDGHGPVVVTSDQPNGSEATHVPAGVVHVTALASPLASEARASTGASALGPSTDASASASPTRSSRFVRSEQPVLSSASATTLENTSLMIASQSDDAARRNYTSIHAAGSVTLNVLPVPTWLETTMRPPCASTIKRAM